MSSFPLLIQVNNEKKVAKTVGELPCGVAFKILKTGFTPEPVLVRLAGGRNYLKETHDMSFSFAQTNGLETMEDEGRNFANFVYHNCAGGWMGAAYKELRRLYGDD